MSGIPPSTATSNVWPRGAGPGAAEAAANSSMAGPMPFGGSGPTGLPTVTNPNLPPSTLPTMASVPPPIPQQPRIPFPSIQQPLGLTNSLLSNNYATAQTLPQGNNFLANGYATAQAGPSFNPMAMNLGPNLMQAAQTDANLRRLTQLEDENTQRRNATSTLQQMGQQVLQGQMDIQEQVLQYQFMLDQCIESLDHQNFILNGQSEEIALLHAKMRQFEFLTDAIKHSKENSHLSRKNSDDANFTDNNFLCSRNPLSLRTPSMTPFFNGGVTRATASKFQPFNPRYRSPNGRSSNANQSQNIKSSVPNANAVNTGLARPISSSNN